MGKLGPVGMKLLKIFHIIFVTLMFGGIICSTAIRSGLEMSVFDEVNVTYQALIILSDHVIRYGAQGSLITGLIFSIWTNWGFFKYRWIAVKWIIFIAQTLFGILFIDRWMVQDVTLLAAEQSRALSNPVFLDNHFLIQSGAIAQSILLVFLIVISVMKLRFGKGR